MKKIIFILSVLCAADALASASAEFTCGPGYVLAEHKKIDGIDAAECQKLWCVDLETGDSMGRGNAANSGYKTTSSAVELEAADGTTIMCWGARKWCAGQPEGQWDADAGKYLRGGVESAYESYKKSGCFTWRIQKHECPQGQEAFLNADGVWECLSKKETVEQVREEAIRRTSAPRRILR